LLAYIDERNGAWTEEAVSELQRLVDDVYNRAVRLADFSAAEKDEEALFLEEEAPLVESGGVGEDGEEERLDVGEEGKREEESEQPFDSATAQAEPASSLPSDLHDEERQQPIPPGRHVLPPLPYSYDALEPHISEEIMRLHHTKHHQSYVDGLNKAVRMMAEARRTNNFELLKHWEREAAFHGSGHYLHTIFWYNMHPEGGGEPRGELRAQIERDFGSFTAFRRHFTEAAKSAEGVGWALLVWAPRAHRLEILQAEKHQHMAQWDVIPLLVLDVWEHAYYLQYKNDRAAYIEHWWNVVNWRDVEARFHEARKLRWQPF